MAERKYKPVTKLIINEPISRSLATSIGNLYSRAEKLNKKYFDLQNYFDEIVEDRDETIRQLEKRLESGDAKWMRRVSQTQEEARALRLKLAKYKAKYGEL